jgi:hypothetical protein
MKAELGLPQEASDAEEVTMDEELDEDTMGALPSEANAADATAGGLSVYKDPNVQSAMTSYNKLAAEQTARYDAMEKALAEKRYGPSFSERMFQLSAALAAPTSRRGFGGILENITPVLAAQQKAQRQGEISRQEALEQLQTNRLAQQVGLAKQGLTTSLAMARINQPKPPIGIEVNGVLVDRATNKPIGAAYNNAFNTPADEAAAYAKLEAEPTEANLKVLVDYYPRYETQFTAAYRRGLSRLGKGTN